MLPLQVLLFAIPIAHALSMQGVYFDDLDFIHHNNDGSRSALIDDLQSGLSKQEALSLCAARAFSIGGSKPASTRFVLKRYGYGNTPADTRSICEVLNIHSFTTTDYLEAAKFTAGFCPNTVLGCHSPQHFASYADHQLVFSKPKAKAFGAASVNECIQGIANHNAGLWRSVPQGVHTYEDHPDLIRAFEWRFESSWVGSCYTFTQVPEAIPAVSTTVGFLASTETPSSLPTRMICAMPYVPLDFPHACHTFTYMVPDAPEVPRHFHRILPAVAPIRSPHSDNFHVYNLMVMHKGSSLDPNNPGLSAPLMAVNFPSEDSPAKALRRCGLLSVERFTELFALTYRQTGWSCTGYNRMSRTTYPLWLSDSTAIYSYLYENTGEHAASGDQARLYDNIMHAPDDEFSSPVVAHLQPQSEGRRSSYQLAADASAADHLLRQSRVTEV